MANLVVASLDDLAAQINAEHDRCQQAYRDSLSYARSCGQLLIQAREQIPRGSWLLWLEANCKVAQRTAYAYMRVAKEWTILEPFVTVANLTFKDALTLLSEADADESVVESEEIVDATFVDLPAKPSSLAPGDLCIVRKRGHLYNGQQVEVLERQSGFYIAKTPDGKEYPFLPAELNLVESFVVQPPIQIQAKPTKAQRLRSLLERVFQFAESHLPADLHREVCLELGLATSKPV